MRARVIFTLFLSCALPHLATAAVFQVDSTDDQVDTNPGDGLCRTAGGVCALRAAINEATALAGADTVLVPSGTFTLVLGTLPIATDLTIQGTGLDSIVEAGAAFRVFSVTTEVAVHLVALTIQKGSLSFGAGGGLFVGGGATLALADCTVRQNVAAGGAGGLYLGPGTSATVLRSTFEDNAVTGTGSEGGAIESAGTLTLVNTTISGNKAANAPGAGISVGEGQTAISFSSFVGNGSSTAFASTQISRYGSATVSVRSSLVAAPGANAVNCSGTLASLGDNLDSGTTCGFGAGSLNNASNPNLGPLAGNGGPTYTHALLSGSDALDAVTGACVALAPTDQRGVSRPQDDACDIGAFEREGLVDGGFEDGSLSTWSGSSP